MASYTTNLNLLKKDPVADASDTFNITTMLNENWDKIDAAMGAARTAEPYSAAKTYAAGDYCTRDGALFKCTVAITTAEAWNAAHWTATSVAAEILAIDSSLSNKADWNGGVLTSDVLLWALSKSAPLSILAVPNTPNMPNTSLYWFVSVMPYPGGSSYDLTAVSVSDGTTWKNTYTAGAWGGWVQLATAIHPTLHDLPLESGWTARNISKYWKDQFGQVSLVFRIGKITPPTIQGTVGYLPVGYRPAHPVHAAATMYPAYVAAVLAIGTDGSIILFSNGSDNSAEGSFCGAVSFVAEN